MINLGARSTLIVEGKLEPLAPYAISHWYLTSSGPLAFPALRLGERLICGLDHFIRGEVLVVCESLEDMQECDELYGSGQMMAIRWYITTAIVHKVMSVEEWVAGSH